MEKEFKAQGRYTVRVSGRNGVKKRVEPEQTPLLKPKVSECSKCVARSCSPLFTELGFESMSARLQKPYYFHFIIEKYI